jgi:hypothetical protein
VTPDQVDMPGGSNRRVPGLRRGEVAVLADVSVEYYSRLERGDLSGVSDGVLEALAGALLLDEAERAHLFDLARTANTSPASRSRRRTTKRQEVRASLKQALDAITGAPAYVRNGRLDLLAANRLGRALYSEMYVRPERPPNFARFAFLDRDRAERLYPDWGVAADIAVAILRTEAGRDPYDRILQDLIGELSTRSDEFRTRWGAHDVRRHSTGVKQFRHPIVGDLSLSYEAMEMSADSGLTLYIHTATPGSSSADGLRLLASWAATQDQAERPAAKMAADGV